MSDSEGDISDELLELAGATEKKRKKRQAKSSTPKRRKADVMVDSDSDSEEPESEEEDQTNPYPLEGKYIDDADRQRLMQMSEIEREELLAQRQEEMQRIQDKRNLDQMLKAQSGHGGEESVSKAAKRHHAVRGATKEKSKKLDELKAKRRAKDEKKRTRNSPKRDRSSSPVDMEMSDEEEEEEGMISKYEELEEKERKMYDKHKSEDEVATIFDLEKCRLSRDMLAKQCMNPWFEEYVKGAYVRYLIGQKNGQPVYRVCEIASVSSTNTKTYKINDTLVNEELELKHGSSIRRFPMDKVSNGPFTQKEFDRLTSTLELDKLKMPSKQQLEKKSAQMKKLADQRMTESDITAMLARKSQLNAANTNKSRFSGVSMTIERSRLMQERTLAFRRQDYDQVSIIDMKLAELDASAPHRPESHSQHIDDVLTRVNERNRKANMEAVRKAEQQEAERKRRERKLLAANTASGTATPTLSTDPSTRLKTVPKLMISRPGTPAMPGTAPGTPSLLADAATSRAATPLAPSALSEKTPPNSLSNKTNFEASVMKTLEIDLGDF
ncbi:RNA polymerase-associated protein [Sparassis crispa]|uniref:RNA polymerase-associated protein n=1 Tax=Sparassis crispa TaxID=139825 RepID=A0A401H5T5_9APHY|nr:RNA polymerase-associated protein [Sparassis crispa]GBE89807.1 RNA polymerase-associated protein [Sparassis crispa]